MPRGWTYPPGAVQNSVLAPSFSVLAATTILEMTNRDCVYAVERCCDNHTERILSNLGVCVGIATTVSNIEIFLSRREAMCFTNWGICGCHSVLPQSEVYRTARAVLQCDSDWYGYGMYVRPAGCNVIDIDFSM